MGVPSATLLVHIDTVQSGGVGVMDSELVLTATTTVRQGGESMGGIGCGNMWQLVQRYVHAVARVGGAWRFAGSNQSLEGGGSV